VDPDDIYFPEAEDIGPHAIAFARLMFAHSEFEREVRSLQGIITSDVSFGERRSNQWKARERPERMAQLIKTHLGNDLREAKPIVELLSDAIGPCDQRNSRPMVVLQHSNVDHHGPQRDAMEGWPA
jgi:hypothetical protein